jgi:hypothetical protein
MTGVRLYDFEILKDDEIIAAVRSIALPNLSAVWAKIAQLAENVDEPGCLIRVTNDTREMVIFTGTAAARRHLNTYVAA